MNCLRKMTEDIGTNLWITEHFKFYMCNHEEVMANE